jgi:hypothetical protein
MLASNRRSARKLNHLFLRCKTQVLSGRRTSSPDDSSIHRCVFCSLFVPGNVLSTSLLSRSNFANCSDWPQASTFCQLTRKDLLQLLIPIQNNIYPIEYRAPFPRPNLTHPSYEVQRSKPCSRNLPAFNSARLSVTTHSLASASPLSH